MTNLSKYFTKTVPLEKIILDPQLQSGADLGRAGGGGFDGFERWLSMLNLVVTSQL